MKSLIKIFLKDIFLIPIVIGLFCLCVIWCNQNELIDRVMLVFLSIISIFYHWRCFQNRNIDRSLILNKLILIVRELTSIIASIFIYVSIIKFWPDFLPSLPQEISNFKIIFPPVLYFIAFKFQFSLMAIAMGIKLSTMLLFFLMLVPALIIIGGFDIKYWAAVTGVLGIWNYINSKDFILFLRKGKKIANIPNQLEYRWQRNKLFANLGTVIFYFSLVISSFFETKQMSIIDKVNPRLYSLLGLSVFLGLVFIFVMLYYLALGSSKSESKLTKLVLWLGKKSRLNKLERTIELYRVAKINK